MMMGSKHCPMAYAGGRHPSVPPSAPPSDVSSQGATCFLGVMGGRRMEDSRALTTVIFFPVKWEAVGVRYATWSRELYCTTWEGSNGTRAASLSPRSVEASSLPGSQRERFQRGKRGWGSSPGKASVKWPRGSVVMTR